MGGIEPSAVAGARAGLYRRRRPWADCDVRAAARCVLDDTSACVPVVLCLLVCNAPGKAVWKLDDPEVLKAEMAERAAVAAAAARKKVEGALERKAKELEKFEGLMALPPPQVRAYLPALLRWGVRAGRAVAVAVAAADAGQTGREKGRHRYCALRLQGLLATWWGRLARAWQQPSHAGLGVPARHRCTFVGCAALRARSRRALSSTAPAR